MGETSWKEEGGLHTDTDLRKIDKTISTNIIPVPQPY